MVGGVREAPRGRGPEPGRRELGRQLHRWVRAARSRLPLRRPSSQCECAYRLQSFSRSGQTQQTMKMSAIRRVGGSSSNPQRPDCLGGVAAAPPAGPTNGLPSFPAWAPRRRPVPSQPNSWDQHLPARRPAGDDSRRGEAGLLFAPVVEGVGCWLRLGRLEERLVCTKCVLDERLRGWAGSHKWLEA